VGEAAEIRHDPFLSVCLFFRSAFNIRCGRAVSTRRDGSFDTENVKAVTFPGNLQSSLISADFAGCFFGSQRVQ
jgi:hypothetical protein